MDARNDKDLVERLRAGDELAFEQFFRDFFPRLFRFALTRAGMDEDAAEEIVQATLVKAVSKLHTYRGEAALFTWLATFCRHEVSAFYRKRGRSPLTSPLVEEVKEIREALESLDAAASHDPESQARHNELSRLVQVTLDHLPRHYADVLEWKYLLGLSVSEIAERLELGPKAAESLLTRARSAFRDGFVTLTGSPWSQNA